MMGLTTYTYHLHGQLQLPIPTTTMVHWEYLYLSRCIENTYTYHYHGPLRIPIPITVHWKYLYLSRCIENTYTYHYHGPLRVPIPITVHWKYLYLPLPRQIPITFIHGILRTKFNFDFSWPHIQSSPRVDVKMMLVLLLHVHKKLMGSSKQVIYFFAHSV